MSNEELKQRQEGNFLKKVIKTATCWIWTGGQLGVGYGKLGINGKTKLAHRFSYELYRSKIPENMTIDHKCMNKLCVNPDHLRVMTQKENNLLGNSICAINKRKTFCNKGHKLDGNNIKIRKRSDGVRRDCLICRRENGK